MDGSSRTCHCQHTLKLMCVVCAYSSIMRVMPHFRSAASCHMAHHPRKLVVCDATELACSSARSLLAASWLDVPSAVDLRGSSAAHSGHARTIIITNQGISVLCCTASSCCVCRNGTKQCCVRTRPAKFNMRDHPAQTPVHKQLVLVHGYAAAVTTMQAGHENMCTCS